MKSKKKFAKKSLGQNFLNSSKIRDRIIKSAGDINKKNILEIGPGLGFLTTKLIASKANVTAIELDDRAIKIISRDFEHKDNFRLIHGNILDQNLDKMYGDKPYSIIANIPYHITSPILKKILANTKNKPTFAILMVQKEVAQKICNPKKRSILSISVEIFAKAEILFFVEREYFSPKPKVDSAVIRLQIRKTSLVSSDMEKDFFTVINAGFSQKRKKLRNVLPGYFGISANKILGNIDGNRRAETLSINEWISITNNFQKLYNNRSFKI